MKNKFRALSAMLALSVLAAGCAKDGGGQTGNDEQKSGEVSRMVLTVQSLTPKGSLSRAADEMTEPASADELTIYAAHGLKVAIFTPGGILVSAQEYELSLKTGTAGTEGAVYSTPATSPITLAEGNYYFYVFANDADDKISLPTAGTSMSDWMDNEIAVSYSNAGVPDIANASPKGFLLGTLWKESVNVTEGGTEAQPKELVLPTLGRLSSKVWVTQLKATAAESPVMDGVFSAPKYRLGSVATKMSNVGIAVGADNPFTQGTVVTSYLHDAAYNSADFKDKAGDGTEWKDISLTTTPTEGGFFYATENTTERSTAGSIIDAQFYGNTTYISMEVKYAPAATEIWAEPTLTGGNLVWANGTLGSTTFWSLGEGENRKIFNADPATFASDVKAALAAVGINADYTPCVYTNGLSYYAFPVNDPEETDPIAKNRVLRNHYYEYTIDGIRDLGAPTEDEAVDDEKPIEENTSVYLSVSVGKWDKVTTGQIVL